MIGIETAMDIKELKREGHSIRAITKMTGHSRNTIRKVLRGEHPLTFQTPERGSKLDDYKDYVRQRFEKTRLSAVRLLEEIKPMGYAGSIITLRRYLRTLRPSVERQRKLTVRFETAPGKQAQADWKYCGQHPSSDGSLIRVYAFVMVLSFSRMMFVKFTTSMKLDVLLDCHREAFEFFGGWPQEILYDNMKQVRISRYKWNERFLDFANYYGFTPRTHQPFRPRTKGKVERLVHYVENNFLVGRDFDEMDDLNVRGRYWLHHTANTRLHGTTGVAPIELFPQEELTPYGSIAPYCRSAAVKRTVNWESMVRFGGSRYSVPPEHAGKTVEVESAAGKVIVRCEDAIIAEHHEAIKAGQSITHRDHLAELWKLTAQQVAPPPDTQPRWRIHFNQRVEQASLSQFEEVCS